jgi:hypothetical protein
MIIIGSGIIIGKYFLIFSEIVNHANIMLSGVAISNGCKEEIVFRSQDERTRKKR